MRHKIISIFFLLLLFFSSHAQRQNHVPEISRDNFISMSAVYGIGFPFGELSNRFGSNFVAGLCLDLVLPEKKWMMSIEYNYIFGNKVREDVLSTLRNENGNILSSDSGFGKILLRQRGAFAGMSFSKIIPISHKYSGLKLGVGFGFLQHKVNILIDSGVVPQIQGDYEKGYDRYTLGPALKQILGYQRIGSDRSVNYSIQLEMIQGFTQNKRPLNFDTFVKDDTKRLDLLLNVTAKWYIPLSTYKNAEEIYY